MEVTYVVVGAALDQAHPRSARKRETRGLACSAVAALIISMGMAVATYFADSAPLYALLVLGVAAGAAMATQMDARSVRAGVLAMLVAGAFAVITIPTMGLSAWWKNHDPSITEAIAAAGGVDGLFAQQVAASGPELWAFLAGSLAVAFVFGSALGESSQDST